jgi:hypothetical protein
MAGHISPGALTVRPTGGRRGVGSGLAASSKGREGEYVILITYVSECTVCVDRTGNLQKKSHSLPPLEKKFLMREFKTFLVLYLVKIIKYQE